MSPLVPTITEQVQILQSRGNATNKEMADLLGVSISAYMRRIRDNNFSSSELETIAKHFGYKLLFEKE